MNVKRVHHVGVVVDDIDEAVSFATGTLGLEAVWTIDKPGKHRAVFFSCGKTFIEMVEFQDADARVDGVRGSSLGEASARIEHIAIEVDDIDQAYLELTQKGVEAASAAPVDNALGRVFTTKPGTSDGICFQFVELGPDAPR